MADLHTLEEAPRQTLPAQMTSEQEEIDYSQIDQLTKQKIGNVPGLLDWIPDAGTQRPAFPFGIVAAIFLTLLFGALVWWRPQPSHVPVAVHPIEATLRWHLGPNAMDSLALEEIKQDTPYKAGAMRIARMGNEFFIRPHPKNGRGTGGDSMVYHFNVKGNEKIQLFFEDATRVQLAANSDLIFHDFPPGALPKEKELECSGEVLVSVDPNFEIPTTIKTRRQRITVLGTLFKVRDYPSEDSSAVICYNGKIAVDGSGAATEILGSGQRATIQPGQGIKVSNNDFPTAHWSSKELVFDFSNDNFDEAMHEIARWYGISTVKFEGPIDKTTRGIVYTGPISRYLTLQQLLHILEHEGVQFLIQDDQIVVK